LPAWSFRTGLITLTLLALGSLSSVAIGETAPYPNKTIRVVAPWPPGGANDKLAREISARLAASMNQSVIVENRGGSNGSIGTDMVAKSLADGYTLMVQSVTSHATNPAIYANLHYDTESDFQLVSLITEIPQVIVAHPDYPVKTLKDLVQAAKAKPGTISYASYGSGSPAHLAGELFKMTAKVDLVHIPYKGGGPALLDTMAGHVPIYFASMATVMQQIKAGKLKALAMTGSKRSALLPDVPTVNEALGINGYELSATYALFVPAKTPKTIVSKLNAEMGKILSDPSFKHRLEIEGADGTMFTSPEESTAFLKAEVSKFAALVRDSGAKRD
jgi:tripartite-type tricarboxylate transporter receptor subunit TctC